MSIGSACFVCSTWLDLISQAVEVLSLVALSGFYLSSREIMGRKLFVFTRRKIQGSSDEAKNDNMSD